MNYDFSLASRTRAFAAGVVSHQKRRTSGSVADALALLRDTPDDAHRADYAFGAFFDWLSFGLGHCFLPVVDFDNALANADNRARDDTDVEIKEKTKAAVTRRC